MRRMNNDLTALELEELVDVIKNTKTKKNVSPTLSVSAVGIFILILLGILKTRKKTS